MQFPTSIQQVVERLWQRIFRTRAEDILPHEVTHQRAYIVPTKRGFAFCLALLLMLVASVNYALSLGYALCFILTGLFAATLLHTYRNLAGVQVEKIKHFDTFAGHDACFLVSLVNKLNEPRHGLRVGSKNSCQVMASIEPRDTSDVMLVVPATSRGIIHLGRLTLQSDWPLGLWTCWSYVHTPVKALAFPTPEADAPPMPSSSMQEDENVSLPGNEGDVSGLRQYRPGDSMGSIAWKCVAKGAGMQVRTFDSNNAPAKAIFSLDNTGQHRLEEQLSRLCAWVVEAESRKSEFAMKLRDETLASNTGETHYKAALKLLALHGISS